MDALYPTRTVQLLNLPPLVELALFGTLAVVVWNAIDKAPLYRPHPVEGANRKCDKITTRVRDDQVEPGSSESRYLAAGIPIMPGSRVTGVTIDPTKSKYHVSRDIMAATADARRGGADQTYDRERARNLRAANPHADTWFGGMIGAMFSNVNALGSAMEYEQQHQSAYRSHDQRVASLPSSVLRQ